MSPHGLVFAILQISLVLALWWGFLAWQGRTPTTSSRPLAVLSLALIVEYALLRYQPIRMGGSAFEYTLGLFDAATAMGLAGLLTLHMLHRGASSPRS